MTRNESQDTKAVAMLLVSANRATHGFFQAFCDLRSWQLHHAWTVSHAEAVLLEKTIPVVVTDDSSDADEMAKLFPALQAIPPRILVCTWPYREHELFSALTLAWLSWRVRAEVGWNIQYELTASSAMDSVELPKHS